MVNDIVHQTGFNENPQPSHTWEHVPESLKMLRQWVLWRYETRNGKRTKIPYQPNGQKSESDNPKTWSTFDQVITRFSQSGFDGIGIMFGNGLAGVDLDHHVDEHGQLSDFSKNVIFQISSYTELSPSRQGLHILFMGELPPGRRRDDDLGIEMYSAGRFFTVTGIRLDSTPTEVNTRTAEVADLHRQIFGDYKEPAARKPSEPNSLDDSALIEKACSAKNGSKFTALWNGNCNDYNGDQSRADLALCSSLAFWTGGDTGRMDSLFRMSGLMREKWDEIHSGTGATYGQMTIERSLQGTEYYTPHQNGRRGPSQKATQQEEPQPAGPPKERRKDPQGAEYVEFLEQCGYKFRLCDMDDSLWVNDERMSDPLEAEIKTLLRDHGYSKVNVAGDAYLAHARANSFHPILNFFDTLEWDGQDHIKSLARYIADRHDIFELALRKWLLGAVARPLTRGKQNRVLVLEGDQGVGKSYFARWIASPLEDYFSEAMPDPDNKDSRLALATTWIWEIKELGSVTRRADRESLKAWLTLESVSERPPFGKYPIYKPAITSFVATVNDEGGFFNDPTGSRRYMTVAVKTMDWNYSKNIDPRQVWAQAVSLFKSGEDWNLTPEEARTIGAVNAEYEFSLPSYDWLDRYIEDTPGAFLETATILQELSSAGNFGKDTQLSREIAGWMKRNGYEQAKEYVTLNVKDDRGNPKQVKKQVRGYKGVAINRKYTPVFQSMSEELGP